MERRGRKVERKEYVLGGAENRAENETNRYSRKTRNRYAASPGQTARLFTLNL